MVTESKDYFLVYRCKYEFLLFPIILVLWVFGDIGIGLALLHALYMGAKSAGSEVLGEITQAHASSGEGNSGAGEGMSINKFKNSGFSEWTRGGKLSMQTWISWARHCWTTRNKSGRSES